MSDERASMSIAPCDMNDHWRSWVDVPHPRPGAYQMQVDDSLLSNVVPHVSNIEYVRWIDRVAEFDSDAHGWTRDRLLEQGRMWFVARHEIDYLAETWANDTINMLTWVDACKRVKAWRETCIVRPSDETVIARARTLWVLVDLDSRRPCRLPQSMIDDLDPLQHVPGASSGAL